MCTNSNELLNTPDKILKCPSQQGSRKVKLEHILLCIKNYLLPPRNLLCTIFLNNCLVWTHHLFMLAVIRDKSLNATWQERSEMLVTMSHEKPPTRIIVAVGMRTIWHCQDIMTISNSPIAKNKVKTFYYFLKIHSSKSSFWCIKTGGKELHFNTEDIQYATIPLEIMFSPLDKNRYERNAGKPMRFSIENHRFPGVHLARPACSTRTKVLTEKLHFTDWNGKVREVWIVLMLCNRSPCSA